MEAEREEKDGKTAATSEEKRDKSQRVDGEKVL